MGLLSVEQQMRPRCPMKALSDKANRSYSDLSLNLCVCACMCVYSCVRESTHTHTAVVCSTLFLCPAPGTLHEQTCSQLLLWPSSLAMLTSWRPHKPNCHKTGAQAHAHTHNRERKCSHSRHSGKQETMYINRAALLSNWLPHTSLALINAMVLCFRQGHLNSTTTPYTQDSFMPR